MYFDKRINVRLRTQEHARIVDIYKKNKHLYESPSHVVRAAIIQFISKKGEKNAKSNPKRQVKK